MRGACRVTTATHVGSSKTTAPVRGSARRHEVPPTQHNREHEAHEALVAADLHAPEAVEWLARPIPPAAAGARGGEPRGADKLPRASVLVAVWIGERGHGPAQPLTELPPGPLDLLGSGLVAQLG